MRRQHVGSPDTPPTPSTAFREARKFSGNPQTKADRAIAKADRLLNELDTVDAPTEQRQALQQGKATLSQANAEYKLGNYEQALTIALDLSDTLDVLKIQRGVVLQNATLQEVEGAVEVKHKGQHLFGPGRKNLGLSTGDIVKTGKDGFARIRYHTGITTTIQPDTLMVIQIGKNPQGGDRIHNLVQEGTVQVEIPETMGPNDESIISTDSAEIKAPADSRVEVAQSKTTGATSVSAYKGLIEVESVTGEKKFLEQNKSITTTPQGLGAVRSLLGPPAIISPRDGEILRVEDPTLQPFALTWADSRSAVRFQISGKPLFSALLTPERTVSGNSVQLQGLPQGMYYWRLRAVGDDDRTHWSKIHRFRIMQEYKRPQIERDLSLTVNHTLIGDGIILQGKTDAGVHVSVNNLEIPVNADGSFSKIYLFRASGTQMVVVRAFDEEGNEAPIWRKQFQSSAY